MSDDDQDDPDEDGEAGTTSAARVKRPLLMIKDHGKTYFFDEDGKCSMVGMLILTTTYTT